jgi:hypothetical protein
LMSFDFEAGRMYTFPDLSRQITFSPLTLTLGNMLYLTTTRVMFLPLSVGSGTAVRE